MRILCWEKLGTSHDVKSFAISSFLEHFIVKIANDYKHARQCKIDRFLARFVQKLSMKLAVFYRLFFGKVSPENFREFDFFSATYHKPVVCRDPSDLIVSKYRRQKVV